MKYNLDEKYYFKHKHYHFKINKEIKIGCAELKDQSHCVYLFFQQPKPGEKRRQRQLCHLRFCKNKINLTKDATILLRRTISRNV